MYDALNKDCACQQEISSELMHSDDEFYDASSVANVAAFKNNSQQTAYTAMVFMSLMTKRTFDSQSLVVAYSIKKVKAGTVAFASYGLFKKSIIDSYGFYNLDFKIASDTGLSCATCINTESR
jgi:glycosyltransferase